jgi:cell division protein FtsQ
MSPTATGTRPRSAGATATTPPPGLRHQLEQRQASRRRVLTGLVVLAAVVVAAVLLWLVAASSVFAARQVSVTGQRELTAEQVQEAAAVPLGVPLLRQDLDAIAQRATTLPQVASAQVVRDWPRTVAVTVTEREPLLAIRQPDGFALVDARGVAYETRPAVPAGVVPTDADPTATGRLVDLAVVAAALPPDLRTQVTRMQAPADGEISLLLASGTTVRWGDSRESALKAGVVAALLEREPRTIDVSAPHNPASR